MTESPQKNSASTAITILAVLAVLYTLYFARNFLVPIVFAALLAFVLSPAVRFLTRLRIPEWLGAAIVVLGLVGAVVLGGFQLAAPVQTWTAEAPAAGAVYQDGGTGGGGDRGHGHRSKTAGGRGPRADGGGAALRLDPAVHRLRGRSAAPAVFPARGGQPVPREGDQGPADLSG